MRRVGQYDELLEAYLETRDDVNRYQTWASRQISSRPDRVLPPVPLLPALPVFERFQSAWTNDGSLAARYRSLQESEQASQRLLIDLKAWKELILHGKKQKRARNPSAQSTNAIEATANFSPISILAGPASPNRATSVTDKAPASYQGKISSLTPPPEETESFLLAMQHTPVRSSCKPASVWSDLRPDGFASKEVTLRRTDRKRKPGSDGVENSVEKSARSPISKLNADSFISPADISSTCDSPLRAVDNINVVRPLSPNQCLSQRSIPTPSRLLPLPPHRTFNLDLAPVQLDPDQPTSSSTTSIQRSPIHSPITKLPTKVRSSMSRRQSHASASPSRNQAVESPNTAELKFYAGLGTPPLPAPDWEAARKLEAKQRRKRERHVESKTVESVEKPMKRSRLDLMEREYEREAADKSAKTKVPRKRGVYVDPVEGLERSRTPTISTPNSCAQDKSGQAQSLQPFHVNRSTDC